MDRRSWPWKKKSSDKSSADKAVAASESVSVDASTGSHGDKVKQDNYKKPNYVQISVESYSHLTGLEDQVKSYEDQVKSYEDQVKSYDEQVKRYEDQQLVYEDQIKSLEDEVKDLNEQLSEAHSEMTTKENLVKQHAKVAEEAVSGWEKAESEAATLKNHLESVTLLKLTAEDRASHLDGALKECMRQIRNLKEEHEQIIHDVVLSKTKQWDKLKQEFDTKVSNLNQELLHSASENAALSRSLQDRSNMLIKISEEKSQAEAEIELLKSQIDSCEREINSLKYELHIVAKELEIRNEEKNMSLRSAEVANKQHSEGVKKIAKLEAECQRLRGLVRKKLPGPAALAQMKLEVDNLGREHGDNNNNTRVKRSPVKALPLPASPHSPHFSSLPDFSIDTIQKFQKENDLLTERLLGMEEETKMLKEALAKRNTELQASRSVCAKTVSKLQSLEAQLVSKSSNPPSVASFSEGNDDETSFVSEFSHNRKDKNLESPQRSESASRLELMDDFLEMEKLACSSNDEDRTVSSSALQVAVSADSEKPESDHDPTGDLDLDSDPDLKSRISTLLKSLPKDTDFEKLFEVIKPKDQELEAAISKIYDFVLTLSKEAKSTGENGFISTIDEFCDAFKESERHKINVNEFVLCLSKILGKAVEFRFSLVGYEINDAETSSPDCIDKVALPENNRVTQFSDSTSEPDIPHEGSSVPTSDSNVSSWKCTIEEFEQLKLEKEKMGLELEKCNEHLETIRSKLSETETSLSEVKSQLVAAQKSNGLSETQLKCMAESYNSLEVRAEDLQSRVNVLESKIEALDNELQEERKNHMDTEARCKDLQEQLQRLETAPATADMDAKSNQERELAAAAEKLAECQETIFLLGKQLNGLRPQPDFTPSPLHEKSQKGQTQENDDEDDDNNDDDEEELVTTSSPLHLHNNHLFSPSDSDPLRSPTATITPSKTSKHRPTKSVSSSSSSSNPTPEKNTRGFTRFFSTKPKSNQAM